MFHQYPHSPLILLLRIIDHRKAEMLSNHVRFPKITHLELKLVLILSYQIKI